MSHPRDPRNRRHRDPFAPPVDAMAAAVRLELGADAMRAALTTPEPEYSPEYSPAEVATTVQLGTVEPPMTADDLTVTIDVDTSKFDTAMRQAITAAPGAGGVAESEEPAPAPPVAPVPPAPAFVPERSAPALTWRSRHDERSRGYAVRDRLAGAAPLQNVRLETGPVLDQGTEGACVGFAVVDAWAAIDTRAAAALTAAALTEDAAGIFDRADVLDGDGVRGQGTSVLAGMKAGVEAGLFGGYLWAFGTRDIAQALIHRRSPVIVGVPWRSGMYDTGPGGLVQIAGDEVGGHCLAVVGLALKGPQGQPGPYFLWQNSWGTGYGDGGFGWIHHRDLAQLLHGYGEAAIPTAEPQVSR